MLSILSFFATIGEAALKIWNYFSAKKHDELVQDAQRATDGEVNAAADLSEVQNAKEARDSVDSNVAADPDSLRKSDGFAIGGGPAVKQDDKH